MHIHVLEPRADGHRLQYVRRLLAAAPRTSKLTFSTFPSTLKHPGMLGVLEASHGQLDIHIIGGEESFETAVRGTDGFKLQPAYWRLFHRHWGSLREAQKGDQIVVPYWDYCSYATGALGSPFSNTPFSGIVMRPDFHWATQSVAAPKPKFAALKKALFLRMLRGSNLTRLVTIDPSLRDWVGLNKPACYKRLAYADDPADLKGSDDRLGARNRFGLAADAKVILIFGAIDLRKGVADLLDVTEGPNFPDTMQVLIVGKQSAAVAELLAERVRGAAKRKFICVNRYVDREEEWAAFVAADFCWIAYRGFFGPSGVLAQCRQMGLPMIFREEGLIGYQLRAIAHQEMPWLTAFGLKVTSSVVQSQSTAGLEQVFS